MAFKPLDFFRIKKKATKVILVLLGVVCMFLFVIGDIIQGRMSGGGNSAGRSFRRWFGMGSDYDIAKINNRFVDKQELEDLFRLRRAVLQFASMVEMTGRTQVYRDGGFTDQEAAALVQLDSNPYARFTIPQELQQRAMMKQAEMQKSRPDDVRALLESRGTLTAQLFQADLPSVASPEGLVEFLIWKKKADDLGIVLSTRNVRDDLLRAGANRINEDQLPGLARRMGIRYDVDVLLENLSEELRVMIARGAILGVKKDDLFGMGFLGAGERLSVQVTPFDLWDAYVRVKTQLTVGILPIPVNQKDFLAQVPEPTTAELKEFFNKHREQEPSATRETPGFKVPELYQIQFLYADLRTNDYYRKWAEALRALDPAGFQYRVLGFYMRHRNRYRTFDPYGVLVSGTGEADASFYKVPLPLGPGPWATVAGVEQQTGSEQVMGLASLAAGPLSPLGFISLLQPGGEKMAKGQAQSLELASLAANAVHGLPGLISYPPRFVYVEKYEPLEKHQAAIADEIDEENRRMVLEGDLEKLEKDLLTYSKEYQTALSKWKQQQRSRGKPIYGPNAAKFEPPPFLVKKEADKPAEKTAAKPEAEKKPEKPGSDKKEPEKKDEGEKLPIDEYLKRFAAVRGLMLEGTSDLRSRENLFKEEGKTPLGSLLKPVFLELEEEFHRRFMRYTAFDNKRFQEQVEQALLEPAVPYEPRMARAPSDSRGMRMPGDKQWLYALHWKSAQTEGRTPNFEEAMTQIYAGWTTPRDAWKLEKARDLAKQRAETLVKEVVASKPDGFRKLKDMDDYRDDQIVARFERALDLSATSTAVNYSTAKLPVIDKPTADLLDEVLVKLKEKGDALVVHDQPKSHYYVLVLKKREEPTAVNPEAVKKFDQEVMIPDRINQLHVNGRPISEFATSEKQRSFIADWEKALRTQADYQEERGKAFADQLSETLQRERQR